ncbi:MAG: acyltransferase [Pseudomonadota bacterium]
MAMQPPQSVYHNRSPWLDCIRAVAIFMVLVFHVATRYPAEEMDPIAAWFLRNGSLGVDVFFPLSGYLITRFLLESQRSDMVRVFFMRRVFRIMPIYYIAILVYIAASIATGIDRELLGGIWAPLTFTTGWLIFFTDPTAVPFQITWSLSVEEFAYILFGLAALIARRHFIWCLAGFSIFAIVLRFWLVESGYQYTYFLPVTRLDAIAIGGLLAWAVGRKLPVLPILLGLLVLLSVGILYNETVRETFYLSRIAVLTCLAIVLAERLPASWRPLAVEPFARLGFYSYFIYLFHFFFIYGLFAIGLQLGLWSMVLLALLLTYIAAVISWRFFEHPLIAWGRRLEGQADKKQDMRRT